MRRPIRWKKSANILGADTLGYLSVEGLRRAVGDTQGRYCLACYTGDYPTAIQEPLIAIRNRD